MSPNNNNGSNHTGNIDRQQSKSRAHGYDILKSIEERIALLGQIKAAVRVAWGLDDEAEEVRAVVAEERRAQRQRGTTTSPKIHGNQGRRGLGTPNKDMILSVLRRAGSPLSTTEVYNRMVARGWTTTSGNPKGLVQVTLRAMAQNGKLLRRVGMDYELTPATAPAASTPAETEPTTTETINA